MPKKIAILFLLLLISCLKLQAYNDQPRCLQDLEVNFFNPQIVSEALSLYSVDMNIWPLVNQELKRRSLGVPSIMKQRSDRMSPSPLEYPFQPLIVGEMLRQILLDIFTSVISDFRLSSGIVTSDDSIREMFGYIRRQQKGRIEACLGENAMEPNAPQS